jgi:hypothetical protein
LMPLEDLLVAPLSLAVIILAPLSIFDPEDARLDQLDGAPAPEPSERIEECVMTTRGRRTFAMPLAQSSWTQCRANEKHKILAILLM